MKFLMGGLWPYDTSVWGPGGRLREDDRGSQKKACPVVMVTIYIIHMFKCTINRAW